MKFLHTISTSGKTHRLAGGGHEVTIRYRERPLFSDQVQGDLIRKLWETVPGGSATTGPIGRVPVQTEPQLDQEELDLSRPTPEQLAEAVIEATPWSAPTLTKHQVRAMLIVAISQDRDTAR